MAKGNWAAFQHVSKSFDYPGAKLESTWAKLHAGDQEPFPDDERVAKLIKANPNYEVSVKADFLLWAQRDAVNNARKVSAFKTKHLNEWVQAREAFFNIQRWHESADPEMKLDDFAGQRCIVALDLASKVDIAAMVILFRRESGGFAAAPAPQNGSPPLIGEGEGQGCGAKTGRQP